MPAFVTGFSSNNPVSRGIRRGICCRCLPDACSASPIKLGEMRKTKLYQSCHASRPRSCRRSHRRRGITSACAEQTNGSTTDAPRRRDHLRVCGADLVESRRKVMNLGSPPRVRSRRAHRHESGGHAGITSACAEQTGRVACGPSCNGDHLRVCGADVSKTGSTNYSEGSPPRVRSRPSPPSITPESNRDHLRVCGADYPRLDAEAYRWGSPPRVRSRLWCLHCRPGCPGITSACAEQTPRRASPAHGSWDHLRVCGADASVDGLVVDELGSPPRVRSRPDGRPHRRWYAGITSACAEQTCESRVRLRGAWDHLRVCGADASSAHCFILPMGSPPRVRSRPSDAPPADPGRRITSACAEQTHCEGLTKRTFGDHLRVCGADSRSPIPNGRCSGSPPRVRSRLRAGRLDACVEGITSACAEQT